MSAPASSSTIPPDTGDPIDNITEAARRNSQMLDSILDAATCCCLKDDVLPPDLLKVIIHIRRLALASRAVLDDPHLTSPFPDVEICPLKHGDRRYNLADSRLFVASTDIVENVVIPHLYLPCAWSVTPDEPGYTDRNIMLNGRRVVVFGSGIGMEASIVSSSG